MSKKLLTPSEKKFVRKAMRYFGIKTLRFSWDDSKKTFPDIWVNLNGMPVITVTQEWMRQSSKEKVKRIVHEILHIKGKEHNGSYSTYPDKDVFSMKVYNDIVSGGSKYRSIN